MRTRTALLCLAVFAAGAITSMAQNVYSLNVVGYVKKTYPGSGALSLIANPLNTTNNTVGGIFGGVGGSLPEGTQVYLWTGTTFTIGGRDDLGAAGWSPDGFENQPLPPGKGAFLRNNATTPIDVVYVGEVLQSGATPLKNTVGTGLQLLGSMAPLTGQVDKSVATGGPGFPVTDGDQVYIWNGTTYAIFTADSLNDPAPWGPTAPSIDLAQGFFSRLQAQTDWLQDFKVPTQ